MENLEKVELVREKCNVSYEEARDALEACDYDVLDAIVMLERASEKTARFV
jgi:NACalpha-BTF3-like transcription factor